MTQEQMLARINELLLLATRGPEPEELVNGALTLMTAAYGADSQQVKTLLNRRESAEKHSAVLRSDAITAATQGALRNLRDEIKGGLLSSIELRVTSDVLSDLIQLARLVLQEAGDGPKNVAAVLVAAAYEDTLRRMAKQHAGVIGQDKLDSVIGKLKDAGVLAAPQLGIALGYLNFRNRALHAEWESIDRTSVTSALALVEELLLKHFS